MLPSLFDSVCEEPQPYEANLVAYLNSAPFIFAFMSAEKDLLNPSLYIGGGPSIMTDGVWNWDYSTAYYVLNYHARVPDEFIQHAKSLNWEIPHISLTQLTEFGSQFFIQDLVDEEGKI